MDGNEPKEDAILHGDMEGKIVRRKGAGGLKTVEDLEKYVLGPDEPVEKLPEVEEEKGGEDGG